MFNQTHQKVNPKYKRNGGLEVSNLVKSHPKKLYQKKINLYEFV